MLGAVHHCPPCEHRRLLATASVIGCITVIGSYFLLDHYTRNIHVTSDAGFLALLLLAPFPIGLLVAVLAYRIRDRL